MTPDAIRTEYLRREQAEKDANNGSFDCPRIMDDMCREYGLKRQDIAEAIKGLVMPPN